MKGEMHLLLRFISVCVMHYNILFGVTIFLTFGVLHFEYNIAFIAYNSAIAFCIDSIIKLMVTSYNLPLYGFINI